MSADPRVSTEAAIARLSAQVDGLGREIGQLRRDVSGDLAGIRTELRSVTEQVRTTNGKVRAHDLQLAEDRARADERARAQSETLARADRRWTRIAWSVGLAATVLLAAVGWAIALWAQ